MPNISIKSQQLPASSIRKLVPYADAAKKRGVHVYHLNIGQPDIETPKRYFEAIKNADIKVLPYSHSAGIEPLREQILTYYGRLGYHLGMDEVIVTTGASEALNFVLATCTNPEDDILVPEPFYANYGSFTSQTWTNIIPVATSIEQDFRLPPVEIFEELITDRTKAIMLCNPGNPTGTLYTEADLLKLRDLIIKYDLFLISDEVYREFVYGDEKHVSILGLSGLEDHAIVIDSISKRFSACGSRIGCVLTRNQEVMSGIMKLAQARLCAPTLDQMGAAEVFKLPQSYYEEIAAEYRERRNVLIEELNKIDGVLCPEINGAFYAMVRLPVENAENFCQWMLEEFTYEGSTVMMAPGAGFYATLGKGLNEVRIAYVLNKDDLRASMECLRRGLAAYPGEEKKRTRVRVER